MLTRQKIDAHHPLDTLSIGTRKLITRGDIHIISYQGVVDLNESDANKGNDEFYHVSERDVLRKLHNVWSVYPAL